MKASLSFFVLLLTCSLSEPLFAQQLHPVIDAQIEAATNKPIAPPSTDSEFVRRIYLDLVGQIPTSQEAEQFINDSSRAKRQTLIDKLLQDDRYSRRMSEAFNVMLMERRGEDPDWQAFLSHSFQGNIAWDQMVSSMVFPDEQNEQTRGSAYFLTKRLEKYGQNPTDFPGLARDIGRMFLGMDLACAQCHDHKYDPFSQKDYYRFFAFFNNTPLEVKQTSGVTWDFYGPKMDLPLEEERQQKLATLNAKLKELRAERAQVVKTSDSRFEVWLKQLADQVAPSWEPVVIKDFQTSGEETVSLQSDGSVLLTGQVPPTVDHEFLLKPPAKPITAIRVEILTDDRIPGSGPGRGDAARPNVILSEVTCTVMDGEESKNVTLSGAVADYSQPNWDVAKAIDGERKTGWAIGGQFGKPHWAIFFLAEPMLLDPESETFRVKLGQYYGNGRVAGKPRVSVSTQPSESLVLPESLRSMLNGQELSKRQRKLFRVEYDKTDQRLIEMDKVIKKTEAELRKVVPETTLVMQEMKSPRETFVMLRGDYENRGESVQAGIPETLPRDDSVTASGDRMELARWLTSETNPLLARVTVNRWWAELFGEGIVPTLEDFGTQSESPSHPQLLDWLASELIASGWSMKHLHRLMVLSAAFQRSSEMTGLSASTDPSNRYLWRGPRFRLPAEMIRDNALAISGLLSDKMFGPPVMPYQPDRIWRSVGRNQPKWIAATDEDRFRRGAYVIWKRAAPYPSFINFDAPDRGTCTVSRSIST